MQNTPSHRKKPARHYHTVKAKDSRWQSPAGFILLCYLIILIPSTLILMTEFASITGLSWLDALFTATSALTVTGLGVVDTGEHFSWLGHVWLMLLMQIGGLGQMTLSVSILILLGKRISLRNQALAREELNQNHSFNIVELIKAIACFAFLTQTVGALILFTAWHNELGSAKAAYYGIFHAISAFNNAGFSLFSDSMMRFNDSPAVLLSISFLLIIGGLGFTVILDFYRRIAFAQKRISLHSKLTLITSAALLLMGTVMFYTLESDNPLTLKPMTLSEQWLAAFFQSASARTAGFNSINIIEMSHAGLFVMMSLMFIGAGSTSTGGGIKVSTFAVAVIATRSFLQNNTHFSSFKRSIPTHTVLKALAIIVVSFGILLSATFCLMVSENGRFDVLLFEAISAFSTVGLSAGLSAHMSDSGKGILIVLMIIGRIGPLTLAYLLTQNKQSHISFAEEDVITG